MFCAWKYTPKFPVCNWENNRPQEGTSHLPCYPGACFFLCRPVWLLTEHSRMAYSIQNRSFFLSLFLPCVWEGMYVCAPYMCGPEKAIRCPPSLSWDRPSYWTWISAFWLGRLAVELQKSVGLCGPYRSYRLLGGCWGVKPRSYLSIKGSDLPSHSLTHLNLPPLQVGFFPIVFLKP